MKIYYSLKDLPRIKASSVTIGMFDGVHLGHRMLLAELVKRARLKKIKSVVVTFTPHPIRKLKGESFPPMLLSLEHRLRLLGKQNVDIALVLNFTKRFSHYTAEEFIKNILIRYLKVSELIVGKNFKLGYNRKGNIMLLEKLSNKYGFRLNAVNCRKSGKSVVSSTLIRKDMIQGNLRSARKKLGRAVSILGTVVEGDKRGRIIGFPTANLDLHHEAMPPSGVYAVWAKMNGTRYKGILNIGFRPTFKDEEPREKTVEVHLFNFNKDIYGRDMEVNFVKKIRPERHFKRHQDLVKRIQKDVKLANRVLK